MGYASSGVRSPIIGADGSIILPVSQLMYSLDAQNGTTLWQFKGGDNFDTTPSCGPDGALYFPQKEGWQGLYRVTPNGKQDWEFDWDCGNGGSTPTIGTDGLIFMEVETCARFWLYALSPEKKIQWNFTFPQVAPVIV